jgi:hypothetical protein
MIISQKLNVLSELQYELDVIRAHFADLRRGIIPPEIQERLDEIAAEETTALESAQYGITALTEEIKTLVIETGATARGDHLMAVWNKGRVTYDVKRLEGYAAAHPEILAFRKEGDPSVSIRGVK